MLPLGLMRMVNLTKLCPKHLQDARQIFFTIPTYPRPITSVKTTWDHVLRLSFALNHFRQFTFHVFSHNPNLNFLDSIVSLQTYSLDLLLLPFCQSKQYHQVACTMETYPECAQSFHL